MKIKAYDSHLGKGSESLEVHPSGIGFRTNNFLTKRLLLHRVLLMGLDLSAFVFSSHLLST